MKWKNLPLFSETLFQCPYSLNSLFLVRRARYSLQISETILRDKFLYAVVQDIFEIKLIFPWFLTGTGKILAAYVLSHADFVLRYLDV